MLLRYFTLAVKLLFAASLVGSVTAAPSASPASKSGYIRFWNMLPPASGGFDLRKGGGGPSDAALFSNAVSYAYGSYVEMPAGKYRLEVHKKGDTNTALRVLDADLKPDSYFTVLVAPQGTGGNIELIDDTIDEKESTGTVTVRNYFPGSAVTVVGGGKTLADNLGYGQTYKAAGFAIGKLPLTIKAKLSNAAPAEGSAEADFGTSKRATLLIMPDSYGRFRPRLTVDGKNP